MYLMVFIKKKKLTGGGAHLYLFINLERVKINLLIELAIDIPDVINLPF